MSLERRLAKMSCRTLHACSSPNMTQSARNAVLAIQLPIPSPTRTSAHLPTCERASSPLSDPFPKPAMISKTFPRMTDRTVLKPAEKPAASSAAIKAPECDRLVNRKSCFHDDLTPCSILEYREIEYHAEIKGGTLEQVLEVIEATWRYEATKSMCLGRQRTISKGQCCDSVHRRGCG